MYLSDVKQKNKVIGAVSLLVLFMTYLVSITAFTHVHYVNGVMIAHSHPFHGTHSHSQTSLLVINHLSTFTSYEADVQEFDLPVCPLLAVLRQEAATSVVKGRAMRNLTLRAPPVFVS